MTHASKKDPIEKAEMAGRGGDRLLGHLTPGDVVIPRGAMTPELRKHLEQYFDIDQYTAGHEKNSVNPKTGLPEFFDIGSAIEGMMGGLDALGAGDMGAAADALGVGDAIGGGGGWDNPFDAGSHSFGANPALDIGGAIPSLGGLPEFSGQEDLGRGGGGLPGWVDTPPTPQITNTQTGWLEQLGQFLSAHAAPTDPTADAAAGLGSSELLSSNSDYYSTPPTQTLPTAPLVPNNVNALFPGMTPEVPYTPPTIGRYYGALSSGQNDIANNLLIPYLSAGKTIYGR